jgi:fungal STAND N-terminal Goodbye domain
MSHSPPGAAPPSGYEAIFDEALKSYKKKTGKDLKSDPLLSTLEACESPNDTLSELERQIPGFDKSEDSDDRLTNWVNPVVNVLSTFAPTISGGIGLVSFGG